MGPVDLAVQEIGARARRWQRAGWQPTRWREAVCRSKTEAPRQQWRHQNASADCEQPNHSPAEGADPGRAKIPPLLVSPTTLTTPGRARRPRVRPSLVPLFTRADVACRVRVGSGVAGRISGGVQLLGWSRFCAQQSPTSSATAPLGRIELVTAMLRVHSWSHDRCRRSLRSTTLFCSGAQGDDRSR